MILCIIQARMSSTRLPGKVLKPILGIPMLLRQIERVHRSKRIDQVILATSNTVDDDPIEELCEKNKIAIYRGSLNDVLDRFYQAALLTKPSHVVRITGDCPVIDPSIVDQVIRLHLEGDYDYTSNIQVPTYPDGLDVEVFRFTALEKAWQEAALPSEREHVTPFIRNHPELFRHGSIQNSIDLSGLRWTVDEAEDFEVIRQVYETLYPQKNDFGMTDILRLMDERPELQVMNQKFMRNEGYQKSLRKDAEALAQKSHSKGE
jgi:spore coat polysaccharide biosynthesis protein SpsF